MTTPPSADFEAAVLCAALTDVPAWHVVTTQLTARDFADEGHRHIFAALLTVTPVGHRTDVLAVIAALRAADREPLVDRVGRLLDAAPTIDPLPNWIASLRSTTQSRRLLAALRKAAEALKAGSPFAEVDRALEGSIASVRAMAPDSRVFDDKRAMASAALAYLEDESRTGTPYGFAPWDAAVLPAMRGHLMLIGGASGGGKSLVGRNLLRQWVQRFEQPTGWLTCEMTGEEQLVHLACIDAEVSVEDYYRRRLTDGQRRAFEDALTFWRDTPLLRVNELGAVTPDGALRIFRRWREEGVTHFLLDHLHRVDYGATRSGDDLRVPVAAFAKALKTFAKDAEALVAALVQYTKMKPNDEPGDDKIREANNILEESDAVFHVWRPLVACERDTLGTLHPLIRADGTPYFEQDAPEGSLLGPDQTAVYVKLGKQRRRLREGLIRVPFNHRLGVMYDTQRPDLRRVG